MPLSDTCREVLGLDNGLGDAYYQAFQHIQQLADVPGPGILLKRPHGFSGQYGHSSYLPLLLFPVVFHQQRNVLRSLAQWGNLDANDIQAVQ